jgi:CubicO group peptidase (beta-lactamase class C family)
MDGMVNSSGRLAAAIERAAHAAIDGKRIVGTVILVSIDGGSAYAAGLGMGDRGAGKPMWKDAIFRLASVSKPMVAATALAMIDDGKLTLDDTVTQWLPEFRPKLADGGVPTITIRQLLTHTSGLTYGFVQRPGHPYHRANVSDGLDQPGLSLEENLRRIKSVPLEFAPGTAWGYSVSIDVVGGMIANANGSALAEAVAQYVTGPLGMNDTGFRVADRARLAPVYADGMPEPVLMADPQRVSRPEDRETALIFSPSRVLDESSFQSGGAGMIGTAPDLMKFMEALRLGGAPILKPETVAMASRNQIGTIPREPKDVGLRSCFFCGIVDDPVAANTPQSAGTLQFGGAWGHWAFIDRPRKLCAIALTNTAVEGVAGQFPIEVRDAIYGALK